MSRGRWVSARYLPYTYRRYDLYAIHKVVLNTREPWRHNYIHRRDYARYKGHRSQMAIRDSRDVRYRDSRNNRAVWYSDKKVYDNSNSQYKGNNNQPDYQYNNRKNEYNNRNYKPNDKKYNRQDNYKENNRINKDKEHGNGNYNSRKNDNMKKGNAARNSKTTRPVQERSTNNLRLASNGSMR